MTNMDIIQVTSRNCSIMEHIDQEIFDYPLCQDRLRVFLASPMHFLAVARVGTLIVGQVRAMVHLQPDAASQLYIDNLGVSPAYQRRGMARRLLRAAFDWGKAQGCAEGWVATELDNEAARGLYEHFMSEPGAAMAYYPLRIG